jgi:HPt (histidine-containing phosphotransfer) domain-containing protein
MNEKIKLDRRKNRNQDIRKLVENAKKIYLKFFPKEYRYSDTEAMEELGLDDELIHQLVEDYVAQIIKSIAHFERLVYELQNAKDAKKELDYTELRELAHKNLGVARNLRIKDGEEVLTSLMKKDDLEYLFTCVEALHASAVCLKPECAFNTIQLLEVKSSF